ncbi:hypothetical protein FRC00_014634 [Tulasnella sp. 408]|nr:hypothetical protein FRC00_014634 [Tulasnella sp. 408]
MEHETAPVQTRTSGPESLTEDELPWLARYEFLKEHGYLLRPRYRPGWTPSWEATPRARPMLCEDWDVIMSRRDDPRNHVVPLLDILEDNVDDEKLLLVLPLLREIQHPHFESIPEALDMIQQTLEGLAFLHENRFAHG